MRELVLLRHAHAVAEHCGGDVHRPLSDIGRAQAQRAAASFLQAKWFPDLILSSPASRTRQTAQIIAAGLHDPPLVQDQSIYLATEYDLLQIITSLSCNPLCLLLVGHNPTISLLASSLLSQPPATPILGTGQWLALRIPINHWANLSPRSASPI